MPCMMYTGVSTGSAGAKLLDPPGISANERLVIERSQSCSVGIASAALAAAKPLLAAATAVTALSCEALQAQVSHQEQAVT